MISLITHNILYYLFNAIISAGYPMAGVAVDDTARSALYANTNSNTIDISGNTIEQSQPSTFQIAKATKRKRRRRGCSRKASARYKKMKRNWQKVPKIPPPKWRNGYRDLTLYSVNIGVRVRVFPFLEDGTIDPEAMVEIEKVFADKDSRATHTVDPRLVKLLYKLVVRFKAKQITVISGYREESVGTESHHANGSAVDFMIPGVKLPALAKVARRLGHVGVGYYPVSGFVHVDVRKKRSYFWVDPSGPGKRSCMRQIMKNHGVKFDRQWKAKMDEPVQKTNKKGGPLDSTKSAKPTKGKKTTKK